MFYVHLSLFSKLRQLAIDDSRKVENNTFGSSHISESIMAKKRPENSYTNPWDQFRSPEYHLADLGRPATFLLPFRVLKKRVEGETIQDILHAFLVENFHAYTTTQHPHFGIWKDDSRALVGDSSQQYEVSFVGKERIPLLLEKLAWIARVTGEECIYVKAGQYAALVYPNRKRP